MEVEVSRLLGRVVLRTRRGEGPGVGQLVRRRGGERRRERSRGGEGEGGLGRQFAWSVVKVGAI